jgi:hypothetical protein
MVSDDSIADVQANLAANGHNKSYTNNFAYNSGLAQGNFVDMQGYSSNG